MRKTILCLVLAGCGQTDQNPPPTAAATTPEVKRQTLEEIDAPKHDFKAMAEAENEVRTIETDGEISASLNGTVTTFSFLPTGSNVAILNEAKGVARVSIAGAPDTKGRPMLRLSIDRVRLDQLTLPAKLEFTAEDPGTGPRAKLEYEITDQKVWAAEPGGHITIESYAGKRVRGSFSGKLAPRSAAFGPPIDVTNGRFEVELRLNGAPPGPS